MGRDGSLLLGPLLLATGGLVGVLGLAGCGGAHLSAAAIAAEPTLLAFTEPGVGLALTDPSGEPLYLYTRDRRRAVTCRGACTATWQPLDVPDGASAGAGPGVTASLIGTIAAPGGGRQITYDRWPLYTYAGNRTTFAAGANGTGLDGGTFRVMTPSGAPAP